MLLDTRLEGVRFNLVVSSHRGKHRRNDKSSGAAYNRLEEPPVEPDLRFPPEFA
jgi:hypothetical protein